MEVSWGLGPLGIFFLSWELRRTATSGKIQKRPKIIQDLKEPNSRIPSATRTVHSTPRARVCVCVYLQACFWLAACHFVFLRPRQTWPTFDPVHSLQYQIPSTVQRIMIYHDASSSNPKKLIQKISQIRSHQVLPGHFQCCPSLGEGNGPVCRLWAAGRAGTAGTATGATSEGWAMAQPMVGAAKPKIMSEMVKFADL